MPAGELGEKVNRLFLPAAFMGGRFLTLIAILRDRDGRFLLPKEAENDDEKIV